MKPSGLIDVVHWLEEILERLELRRSYGGAIAYNFYGAPRLTRDVDVLVLLPRARIPALVSALAGAGCVREADPSAELMHLIRENAAALLSGAGRKELDELLVQYGGDPGA